MTAMVTRFTARWRRLTCVDRRDRGEFGPMAATVMISAFVLLALAVVIWGQDIAENFMSKLDGADFDDPR